MKNVNLRLISAKPPLSILKMRYNGKLKMRFRIKYNYKIIVKHTQADSRVVNHNVPILKSVL